MKFDHMGLITEEKKDAEDWVESTCVWVTNPKNHPFCIEWLRWEPNSPIKGPVRSKPHIAYRVKSIAKASKDLKVLMKPFEVGGFLRVGFYESGDGAVIELMEYLNDENQWFDKKKTQ